MTRAHADVVVIGSGISGLAAAARLARRGARVVVLEQHVLAGGYCTSWTRVLRREGRIRRFVFDAGVHDVSGTRPGEPVHELLADVGVADRVQWLPVDHDVVLPDVRLRIPHGADALRDALIARFPGDRAGIAAMLDLVAEIRAELSTTPGASGGTTPVTRRWLDGTWASLVQSYVRNRTLRELMNVLRGYTTHRSDAGAVAIAAIVGGYWLSGGRAPRGGSRRLADALVAAIRTAGGDVRLRAPVARIRVSGGQVSGVDGPERIDAPTVISCAGVPATWRLAGLGAAPVAPAASALVVYAALDVVPDAAAVTLVGDGFSIANPSVHDPSLAPDGGACVTVTALVAPDEARAWDRAAPGYTERRRVAADQLVERAAEVIPALATPLYRQDASPATFHRYTGADGGAIYGTTPAVEHHTPIAGLYVCGAGTVPGPGIEAAVRSGNEVARIAGAP